MKKKEIIGENYRGRWEKTRTACRGIVTRKGRILLSFETKTGQWMLPGGGMENGEDERDCCIREVAEETGILIRPSECLLEIDEYYEDWKWVNRYFIGTVTGQTETRLTDREKEVGMEPRWLPVGEIIDIFSRHASYADTDEMRRGMYLREYTALRELIPEENQSIVPVDSANLSLAAAVHSASWQASHRSFCTPAFIDLHTPERQKEYIRDKMNSGSRFYLLGDKKPVGIVSVTGCLIEDLYVLPGYQHQGYGTRLLHFAMEQCVGNPTLWILENNQSAGKLYREEGFTETGRRKAVRGGLDEIEYRFDWLLS